MNSIDTVRQINQIARNHYQEDGKTFNHNSYLRECFRCLQGFFSTELSDKYVFSALTQKNEERDKIELVRFNSGFGYHFAKKEANNLFKSTIKELIQEVNDKQCMSLTETLLKDKRKGKDLFFYSNKTYDPPINPLDANKKARINLFSLSPLTLSSNYDTFESFDNEFNREKIYEFKRILKIKTSDYNLQQIGKLLWFYKRLQVIYTTKNSEKDFIVHFIRPSFIEFGYNILLSLATNGHIKTDQLSFIYLLIYRIISQTSIEKAKEAEELKRKTSFSLTTHALKTELNTTIKPQVGMVKRKIQELSLPASSSLNKFVDDLERQSEDLFCMTGLVSLIDKIGNEKVFVESGKTDGLLTDEKATINILSCCDNYNFINKDLDDIVLCYNSAKLLNIKIYQVYLSEPALKLFLNTIFENVNKFGERDDDVKVELRVSHSNSEWIFENDTNDEIVEIDETKLTGNLLLFKELIKETGSGKLAINSRDKKFKVIYNYANQ